MAFNDLTPGNEVTSNFEHDASFNMLSARKASVSRNILSAQWGQTKHPWDWGESVTGAAAVSLGSSTDPGFLKLETTLSATDSIRFQTLHRLEHIPALEQELSFGFIFNAGDSSQTTRIGHYDDLNGAYWAMLNGTFNVGYRNNSFESTGTIETNTAQANWNYDKLDGDGPSGLNFFGSSPTHDLSKACSFYIRYLLHGSGGIEWGIHFFNQKIAVHRLKHSGTETKPFFRSPILPVRLDIQNTGTLGGATTSYLGPVKFTTYGPNTELVGRSFDACTGTTVKTVASSSVATNLIAVRLQATINGQTNLAIAEFVNIEILSNDNAFYMILSDCSVSGGSWSNVGGDSAAEQNTGSFVYTGGRVRGCGFVAGGAASLSSYNQTKAFPSNNKVRMAINDLTGDSGAVVVIAYKFPAILGGDADMSVALTWKEIR